MMKRTVRLHGVVPFGDDIAVVLVNQLAWVVL